MKMDGCMFCNLNGKFPQRPHLTISEAIESAMWHVRGWLATELRLTPPPNTADAPGVMLAFGLLKDACRPKTAAIDIPPRPAAYPSPADPVPSFAAILRSDEKANLLCPWPAGVEGSLDPPQCDVVIACCKRQKLLT